MGGIVSQTNGAIAERGISGWVTLMAGIGAIVVGSYTVKAIHYLAKRGAK